MGRPALVVDIWLQVELMATLKYGIAGIGKAAFENGCQEVRGMEEGAGALALSAVSVGSRLNGARREYSVLRAEGAYT
jgi:hypothetical protein